MNSLSSISYVSASLSCTSHFVLQVNIHPVRLAMKMPQILLKEYTQVKKVLDLMSEREMKKGTECNEVLAFKFHFLGYILSEIHRCSYVFLWNVFYAYCLLLCAGNKKFSSCRTSQNQTDPFETFVKKILKGSRGEEYLELLLRDCVREFPYRDGFLFQQVLRDVSCYLKLISNLYFRIFLFIPGFPQYPFNSFSAGFLRKTCY